MLMFTLTSETLSEPDSEIRLQCDWILKPDSTMRPNWYILRKRLAF
jgi:hypothetical protein